jgi:Ca-activated chloride channel family protein
MRKSIGLMAFLLSVIALQAQMSPKQRVLDFGLVDKASSRVMELSFVNKGDRETRLLTSNFPREYDAVFSSKTIPVGEELIIRIKLNPFKKGRLNDEVLLYFTDQLNPVKIAIQAKVEFIDLTSNTPCPKFNEEQDCCDDWLFEVELRDAKTLEPLPKSRFRIIQEGVVQRDVITNKKGQYTEEVPIAYYYLIGSEEGYLAADTAMYINRRNSRLTLYLEPQEERLDENDLALQPEEKQMEKWEEDENPSQILEEDDEWTINIKPQETIEKPDKPVELEEVTEASEPPIEAVNPDDEGELPLSLYKPNNIVFLIDVSQSMNQSGKLDILKASMYRLIEALRPGDKVSIMTYAAETTVLLEGVSGDDKAAMMKVIQGLSAGGMTAGAKGFRSAYLKLRANWLAEGNNQVIVVTDGAFRKVDNDIIQKVVRKEQKRGAITTLVAVKSTEYAEKVMNNIAMEGKGSLVEIEDFDRDTDALLMEIKKQSLRR